MRQRILLSSAAFFSIFSLLGRESAAAFRFQPLNPFFVTYVRPLISRRFRDGLLLINGPLSAPAGLSLRKDAV